MRQAGLVLLGFLAGCTNDISRQPTTIRTANSPDVPNAAADATALSPPTPTAADDGVPTTGEKDGLPASTPAPTAEQPTGFLAKVVSITDGDTIEILDANKERHTIRLNGIDTPEGGQAYGNRATQALRAMITGEEVRCVPFKKDQYDRTIGDIYVGDTLVNLQLVKDGWAWHYKRYSDDKDLATAEVEAREAKRGLWADTHEPIAPWDFRRKEREEKDSQRRPPVTKSDSARLMRDNNLRSDPAVASALDAAEERGLVYRGSVVVNDAARASEVFYRISAAEHIADNEFVLLCDEDGKWLRVQMSMVDGRLASVALLDDGVLRWSDNGAPVSKVESAAWSTGSPGDRRLLITRDGDKRILKVTSDLKEVSSADLADLADFRPKRNGGVEAMTRIGDGQYLCIAEMQTSGDDDTRKAWILDSAGGQVGVTFHGHKYNNPGGMTTLASGDVIVVLKNFYRGKNTLAVVRVNSDQLHAPSPDRVFPGEVLCEATSSGNNQVIDNTEAVAAFTHDDKEYILLVTDNNGRPDRQRVIFTLFEIAL